MIARPGGRNHHHRWSCSAAFCTESCIIIPSEIVFDGPRPMKSSVAAIRIAPPNSRMNIMNR